MSALLVIGAALGLLVVASGAAPTRTIPKGAIPVTVGGTPRGRPIPPSFIGLSIEYPSLLSYAGFDPGAVDPPFLGLAATLAPGQSPVIRFGGDTTDWTWWPTRGVRKPGGIRYTLGPKWLAMARATARALNARLILGVNFEADSRAVARAESRAFVRGIGAPYVSGLELGNEPELYGTLGWYTSRRGTPVLGRRPDYDFRRYLGDYASIARALPRTVPLVGPATGSTGWFSNLGRYLAADRRVRVATYHRYPLHRCNQPAGTPASPSIPHLLSLYSSSELANSIASEVATAHAHGAGFRVDELNSVSCGGELGVSDTFASALWSVDILFGLAKVGVDGVNIHTFDNAWYEPFALVHSRSGWSAQVKPLYYGLLLFTNAAPPGSRLLASYHPALGSLRMWATRGPRGTLRVVLLNESSTRSLTFAVRLPGHHGANGALSRLLAPGLSATGGLTIGGRSFGTATATGRLPPLRAVAVAPIGGRYVVALPAASAALLTVPPS